MTQTRTEIVRGSDASIQASLISMEEAGWSVRQMVPASWEENFGEERRPMRSVIAFNTSYWVVFEREVD